MYYTTKTFKAKFNFRFLEMCVLDRFLEMCTFFIVAMCNRYFCLNYSTVICAALWLCVALCTCNQRCGFMIVVACISGAHFFVEVRLKWLLCEGAMFLITTLPCVLLLPSSSFSCRVQRNEETQRMFRPLHSLGGYDVSIP